MNNHTIMYSLCVFPIKAECDEFFHGNPGMTSAIAIAEKIVSKFSHEEKMLFKKLCPNTIDVCSVSEIVIVQDGKRPTSADTNKAVLMEIANQILEHL